MKKLVSLLLVLVMVFSLLPMSALAAEENVQTETEQSLETEGSVGTLLGNTLDGAGAMDEDTSSCSVTDISVDGKTATVEYQTDRAAELVVAIYEESTNRMLGSGHAVVSSDADTAAVEIAIDSMPSYFVVSAYLLDADGLEPLCDAFTSSYYIEALTELRNKTAADFDEDLVLLLEEGNTDTNFLVFSEGTLMAKEGEAANQITDNGDGTYTITNADERYQTLSAGDSFAYTYADGMVLVVVAASVKVDGTTVTVTANTEAELEDVFDYVKIEATSDGADAIVDTSTMGKNATYLGVEDNSSTAKGRAVNENAEWGTSHKIELNFFEKEDDDADIKIEINTTVEFSVKLELKVYLAKKYQFIEFSTKLKTSISGEIVGKITAWEHPLGEYKLPLISGIVYLSFKPKVVLTFEASLTFEMSQSSTIGFVYDSNYGFQSKSEDPEPDQEPEKSLEFEGKVYFGLKVELGLVLVDEDVLGFYVSGEVGFELSMKQDVLEESDSEVHDCDICFEGDISVVGKIGVELKALFDKFNPSTTLLSVKGKLTDIYYSESFGEFGFSVCPHKSYLVTVDCTVIDMNSGEYLDDVSGWKVVVADLESTEPVEQLVLETNKDGKASFYAPNGTYSVVVSPPAELHMSAKGTMVTVHNTATKTPFFFLLPSEGEDGDEDDKTDENTTEPTESDGEVLYSGTCGVGVQWELYESGLLYIYGNGAMANYTSASSVPWHSYRASITRVIVAEGVTSIGRASFYGCTALASVTLPDSLTSVGRDACYGCTSLSSITLPDNLVSIGQGAFRNCTSLSVITIPDNVTSIGSEAFYKCTSLECIVIPDKVASVGSETFYGCTSLSCITLPDNLTNIGGGAFRNCASLTDITLPDDTTSIGGCVFYGCKSLVSIAIPDSVMSIGDYAFYNCTSLGLVELPDSMTSIGTYVFYGCTSLEDITIPDGVTSVGRASFYGCTALASVTLPDSLTSIGRDACYGCTSLSSITLPDNLVSIGQGAFRNCTSLSVITIPDNVTSIGSEAFYKCTSLECIVIPDKVASVGSETFYGCTSLSDITLPDNLTSIGGGAFRNCTSLSNVLLPNVLTSIGSYTFYGCTTLANITIPDSVTSIGNYAFYNCKSLTSIMIPEGVTSIKSYVFYGCTSLADIKIPDDATNIGECAFSGCTSLANITIPDSVVSIGGNAFSACASLASIVLPEGVTRIEWSTFRGCTSLVDITIPDGVTLIGGYAFSGCTSLVDITIPDGVTSIGDSMFNGCSALTSVSIPDGITGITHSAFKRCTSLTSITIPSSVTSVDDYAFWQCFDLVDVYYGGSEEQWEDVTIETHNAPLTSATIHYNYVPTSTVTLDEPVGAVEEATPEEITEEVTEETTEEITEEVTMEETTTEEVTEETTEEITEETVTEETTEETTTEETTTEEKTTYEADEIELLAAYTGAIDGSTASFTGLVPNERYVLLVMKDAEAADPLAAENLLYIVQGVSSETGALSFVYVPREEVESAAAVVYGAGGIDVSHAIITIGVAVGGAVVVKVELDGETLIEDEDYRCTVATGDNGMISVTIVGMDSYYGTALATLDHTPGDMDGKDGVTILDVLALLKAVAGIADKPAHADVNGDGDVTILDVLTLLKYVAGISGTTIY